MKRKLKKPVKIALLSIALLFVIIFILFGFKLSGYNKDELIEYELKKGTAINIVLSELEQQGIIRDDFTAKIFIKLTGVNNFQAGVYNLNKSYSTVKIIRMMKNGEVSKKNEINITLKEGQDIEDLVNLIVNNTSNTEESIYLVLNDDEYIDSLITSYWFLSDTVKNTNIRYPLEGYLFPDTYTILKNSSVKFIIEKMLNQMNVVLTPYKSDIEDSNYSIHEILTMASIVELEGRFDDDRALIAGVLFKRLRNYWTLGSDVTTYYGVGLDMSTNPVIPQSAIDNINPYNTRLPSMAGKLPIGPICSPGRASILATLNPTESDNWYFVADCRTMTTVFNKTLAGHSRSSAEIKASGCKF